MNKFISCEVAHKRPIAFFVFPQSMGENVVEVITEMLGWFFQVGEGVDWILMVTVHHLEL